MARRPDCGKAPARRGDVEFGVDQGSRPGAGTRPAQFVLGFLVVSVLGLGYTLYMDESYLERAVPSEKTQAEPQTAAPAGSEDLAKGVAAAPQENDAPRAGPDLSDEPQALDESRADARDEKSGSGDATVATEPPAPPVEAAQEKQAVVVNGSWRTDNRCGKVVPRLPDGQLAECNPDGKMPCCAPSGWCGNTQEHCACAGCVDYRKLPSKTVSVQPRSIALVVPFRDRGAHLDRFRERINALAEYWRERGVPRTWAVYVVEQFDNALFNRGMLFNAGYKFAAEHAEKTGVPYDCVVMHDIDIVPEPTVDYGWCQWPIQLSGEIECWGWSAPYPNNVGGVVSLSPAHWTGINGFSNEYEGWGGEDDDLYERLKQNQLLKGTCHTWCKDKDPPTVPMVMRPPLGRGRFRCSPKEEHTPRQRDSNDQAMWTRLRAMKANSRRWEQDGISSLKVGQPGPAVESTECEGGPECTGPEDPVPRRRLFREHWSRVSTKPISGPSRIEMHLPPDLQCGDVSAREVGGKPLPSMPAGLKQMRQILLQLFGEECQVSEEFASKANFLLMDVTLGRTLLVGDGNVAIVPDSALPPYPDAGEIAKAPEERTASTEFLLQGQRISRWIRSLPSAHVGWVVVAKAPLPEVREQLVQSGHRFPQTAPVCVSYANIDKTTIKYRVTPGTRWCGNDGWTNQEYFDMLRSKTSVPQEELVSICISMNPKKFTYRFNKSEKGCIGIHEGSQTRWTHVHTIHTTRRASGEKICVGQKIDGEKTRWALRKGSDCSAVSGFQHSFSFAAMSVKDSSPLSPCCVLAAEVNGQRSQRLGLPSWCAGQLPAGLEAWRKQRGVLLLARRHSPSDRHLCLASAAEAVGESQPWRLLEGSGCSQLQGADSVRQNLGGIFETGWSLLPSGSFFVPADASGTLWCACPLGDSQAGDSLVQGRCPEGESAGVCFYDLSVREGVSFSNLIDEVP